MLTYAQVTAGMVREGLVIEFMNLHKEVFRVWQAGPVRVQIQRQSTQKTFQYSSLKNAILYANFCNG